MSELIEKLLDEEFKRLEFETGRIARQIAPMMERLIELDEKKILILQEMKKLLDVEHRELELRLPDA